MIAKMMQWMRGDEAAQDDVPVCRMHHVPMDLFKKIGKPARYADQQNETYYLLFRCTVSGCDETAERRRLRTQIPVPGERTDRPAWATRDRKGL